VQGVGRAREGRPDLHKEEIDRSVIALERCLPTACHAVIADLTPTLHGLTPSSNSRSRPNDIKSDSLFPGWSGRPPPPSGCYMLHYHTSGVSEGWKSIISVLCYLARRFVFDKSTEFLVLSLKRLTSITDIPTYRFQSLLLLLLLLLCNRLCQPTEQSQLSEADSCLFCS